MKKISLITMMGILTLGLFSFANSTNNDLVRYTVIQHVGFHVTVHDTVIDPSSGFTMEDYIAELGLNADDVNIVDTSTSDAQFVSSDTEVWFFNSENSDDGLSNSTFEMNISEGSSEGTQVIMIEQSEDVTKETEEGGIQTVMVKKIVLSDDPNAVMELEEGEAMTITIDSDDLEGEATEMNVQVEVEIDENGNEVVHVFVNGEEVDPETFDGNINIQSTGDANVMLFNAEEGSADDNFTLGIISSVDDENKSMTVFPPSTIRNIKFVPVNDNSFQLSFNNEVKGKTDIKVYDINGRVIFEENLGNFEGEYSNTISLPEHSTGTFILNIVQNGVPTVKKMLLK